MINKKYCVYKHIINNNVFYVGCGNKDRPYVKGRKGKDRNYIWFNIVDGNNGVYDIDIVFESDDKQLCLLEEETLTLYYKSLGMCKANIDIADKHSDETKNKISTIRKTNGSAKGDKNPFYGKHHSEESVERIRNANIGRKDSPEINSKKANYGINNPSSQKVIAVYNDKIKEYDLIKYLIEDIGCMNASAYARGVLGNPKHYWKSGKCFIYYYDDYNSSGK